jgi:hypothetical protein
MKMSLLESGIKHEIVLSYNVADNRLKLWAKAVLLNKGIMLPATVTLRTPQKTVELRIK